MSNANVAARKAAQRTHAVSAPVHSAQPAHAAQTAIIAIATLARTQLAARDRKAIHVVAQIMAQPAMRRRNVCRQSSGSAVAARPSSPPEGSCGWPGWNRGPSEARHEVGDDGRRGDVGVESHFGADEVSEGGVCVGRESVDMAVSEDRTARRAVMQATGLRLRMARKEDAGSAEEGEEGARRRERVVFTFSGEKGQADQR